MKVSPNIRRDAASVLAFKHEPHRVPSMVNGEVVLLEYSLVPLSLMRKARRVAKWVAEQPGAKVKRG